MLILKKLRTEKGISLDKLSTDLNINKSTLSRIENGLREPKQSFIEDCSNYFDVSTDYLLGKTDIKNPNQVVKSLNPIFSKRLRELIKEKGVTLNILGKKLEISTDLLSKYENNIISPKSDDIIKLAHYFDVTTDYLLGTTLVRNHIDTVAAHKANPHEDLPEEAQEQLNDYIEFLMNKYKK
ncbi:TPA: helix-turn-helix transcriptional regulator [Clostridioides difficile]|nr:helix-turn-helix transcriptional regulator [Clostridioides difficile]